MLSREDRILSEILVSRGLVARERIEACLRTREDRHTSLVDVLIDRGEISRVAAEDAVGEARSLEEALAPEFSMGQRLGEFRLVRELGRGGMGIVYEAEQEPLGRRVALKVLPGGAALDDRLAIRFLREARAAGRLTHPGIVSVYTSGRAEGVLYFAMELIEGRTLATLASGSPLAPREAARITAEVARALAHAHGQGLVHRDVKPENILIAGDGSARITDFGLVLEASAVPFTLSRHVLGTPAYISPEQARGESVDARSDVYGLGAVLYFLLAGTAPFAGEVPSLVLARTQTERPPSLIEIRPGISPRLAAICERAMAKDPAARPASADQMAAELEAFLAAPDEEAAALPGPRERTRHRAAIALTLAGGALAIAGFVFVRGLADREASPAPAGDPAPRVRYERVSDTPGRKASPAVSPDGRHLAYASDADGDVDIYLLDLARGEAANLTPDSPGEEASPAFSPDGRSLAFVTFGRPSTLRVLDLGTRQTRDVLGRTISGLAWSSNGKEILFTDRMVDPPGPNITATKLYAVELSTGHVRVLSAMYGAQSSPSRDGRIAFVSPGGGGSTDVWLLPGGGGDALRLTDDDAIEWSPAWSADGREIYLGSDRGGTNGLHRVRADPLPGARSAPTLVSPAVFPGPFYLASGNRDRNEMYLIQTSQGGRLFRLGLGANPGEEAPKVTGLSARFLAAQSPDFSPDGRLLAFSAMTSEEDLAIGGANGSEPRLLTQDAFLDRSPRWSPDGSRIAFESDRGGAMEIWTIRPDGGDLAPRTATGGRARLPVWSPDGTRLAFSIEGRGGFLVAADAGLEAPIEPLAAPAEGGAFEPSSWSADGRTIAGASSGIVLYTLSTGSYRRLTDFGTAPVWLDARRLVFTTERELHLLDARSGQSRVLFSSGPAKLSPRVGVAPDGSALLVSLSASPREIWRVEITD